MRELLPLRFPELQSLLPRCQQRRGREVGRRLERGLRGDEGGGALEVDQKAVWVEVLDDFEWFSQCYLVFFQWFLRGFSGFHGWFLVYFH